MRTPGISKGTFFFTLCLIIGVPFLTQKIYWLASSHKARGTVGFQGKSMTGQLVHSYSVISFMAGSQKVWFNSFDNMLYPEGTVVEIRYQPAHPEDARLSSFVSLWGDTLVYGGIPMLLLLIVFLHPQIIARGSRIFISWRRPFIRIIPPLTVTPLFSNP